MDAERYTPGHSDEAAEFMALRSFESHGRFFAPHLDPSHTVLDAGCGPGSITLGLAAVAGRVTGLDFEESQVERARAAAQQAGVTNVEFRTASCYSLPFEDASFDRVFCHALLEHLARPIQALSEFHRVLRPGGVAGICSPDFDGFLVSPWSPRLESAFEAYADLQVSNGGNPRIGKELGRLLDEAGFREISLESRYENYPSLEIIGEYFAVQLDRQDEADHAAAFRDWMTSSPGLFAQSWVAAVGTRPPCPV